MSQYTIHEPADAPSDPIARADATQLVKEGMAWPALFVPLLWLIYHRMWIVLAGFIAVLVVLQVGLGFAGFTEGAVEWAGLVLSLLFAMHANDLRRWTLKRRGFAIVGAVSGRNHDECELKYFSSWPETNAAAAPRSVAMTSPSRLSPQRSQGDDDDEVIGLFPEASR